MRPCAFPGTAPAATGRCQQPAGCGGTDSYGSSRSAVPCCHLFRVGELWRAMQKMWRRKCVAPVGCGRPARACRRRPWPATRCSQRQRHPHPMDQGAGHVHPKGHVADGRGRRALGGDPPALGDPGRLVQVHGRRRRRLVRHRAELPGRPAGRDGTLQGRAGEQAAGDRHARRLLDPGSSAGP